jgi:curved DNA-binding protein CbpA
MAENFYDLLGVSEDASTAVIEDAYREEIKRVHPDVSDDVDAGERTKRLNKAKQVLTDDDERARYDSVGHETYTSGSSDSGAAGTPGGNRTRASPSDSDGAGRSSSNGGSTRSRSRATNGETRGSDRSSRGAGAAGRADGHGGATATGSPDGTATATGTAKGSSSTWSGRRGDGRQGRSSPSRGPAWQSSRARRATGQATGASSSGAGATATGPSGQRQASAGSTRGPGGTRSWNAWEQTRSWAVRQGGTDRPGFDPNRLVPTEQSVLLLVSTFFLYPFFVASALYPLFPVVARLLVALCTLMMFAYLLSVPEVSVAVFGLWSVLAPVALVALPGVGLFSLLGVVALSTTWVPFGLSVLTLSMMES